MRHLPAELTTEEKEDLLKYFGAQSVRVLSDKGRLVRPSVGGSGRGHQTEDVVEEWEAVLVSRCFSVWPPL